MRRALHVATLAGRKVSLVKRQRIALRELRVLPFVIRRECANLLVLIQGLRKVCLVACGAKLRSVQQRLHHRFRMPIEVRHDLRIRRHSRHPIAVFIHQHRGHSHHVPAVAQRRLHFLNRVAGHARQPILIELPVHHRVLRQPARQHCHRVMATVAMPRKLDSLGVQQYVHARPVKRGAK